MSTLLVSLGGKIRERREKLGLKQHDIANALDLSPQAVSKWERGENAPDVTVLKPLARLLGVSVDWLLAVHEEARDTFEAAVLATAVRGAHKRALGMRPREFAAWANGMFFQLTEITLAREGVPIKYVGDGYLCFFSGPGYLRRALDTALQARAVVSEDLQVGLSSGEIYLGAVGHPDYARPDIMGQVVNIAFLAQQWAEANAAGGMVVTKAFRDALAKDPEFHGRATFGRVTHVDFRGVKDPVAISEVQAARP